MKEKYSWKRVLCIKLRVLLHLLFLVHGRYLINNYWIKVFTIICQAYGKYYNTDWDKVRCLISFSSNITPPPLSQWSNAKLETWTNYSWFHTHTCTHIQLLSHGKFTPNLPSFCLLIVICPFLPTWFKL